MSAPALTPAQGDALVTLFERACRASLGSKWPAQELKLSPMVLGRLRQLGLVESERVGEGIGYERRYHTVYGLTPAGRSRAYDLHLERTL